MERKLRIHSVALTLMVVVCAMTSQMKYSSGESIKSPITYYLEEELPVGHLIGRLIEEADLSEFYSADELDTLQFTFISTPNGHVDLFNLTLAGVLSTGSVIDRDALCPMKEDCVLSLDVEISPVEYFQILKIEVVIVDINDNSPTFEQPVFYISVSETIPVGSVVPIPMAYDPDSPKNGISHYELREEGNSSRKVFSLKANDDVHDLYGEIYIQIVDYLDREEKSKYILLLTAVEGDEERGRRSSLLIHVLVSDVNDNMPVFTQSKYTVTVPEDIDVDKAIIQVLANDLDSGENGQITYSLSARSVQSYASMFSVDSTSGEIFLSEKLDYEEEKQYSLVVVAADKTINRLTSETLVIINVSDVNDNAPEIIVTSLSQDSSELSVQENGDPQTPVAHISVKDPDQGLGGTVSCVLDNSVFSLNQIYANDFMLRSTRSLDREEIPNIEVTITCKDHGEPELISTKMIEIQVMDVNDNKPLFDDKQYNVIISNGVGSGESIFQVSATDRDEGENAIIKYSIVNSDMKQLFSINATSGMITADVNISRDFVWDFELIISAEDHGEEPLSSTTLLIISSSENRTCSEMSKSSRRILHVMENGPGNVKIAQINNEVKNLSCHTTGILYPNEVRNIFKLNTDGELIVKMTLDRETEEMYCFGIVMKTICGQFNERLETVKMDIVQVKVDDENDNAPTAIFPNAQNNTITIDFGRAKEPRFLAEIKATDADDEENGSVTYWLLKRDLFDCLWLNSSSGELYLVGEMTNEMSSKPIRILLADNGSPALNTTTTLWINVTKSGLVGQWRSMVSADDLTTVLSIAAPCGVVVVLTLIFAVLLCRKRLARRKEKRRNHVDPTTAMMNGAGEVNDKQLEGLYQDVKFSTQASTQYWYTDRDLSECVTQINKPSGDMIQSVSKCIQTSVNDNIHQVKAPHVTLSSQDSDSGCSADMSHSTTTTDSWVTGCGSCTGTRLGSHQLKSTLRDIERHRTGGNPDEPGKAADSSGAVRKGTDAEPSSALCGGSSENYENDPYIMADSVRKYGLLNDADREDPECAKTKTKRKDFYGVDRSGERNHVTDMRPYRWRHVSDIPSVDRPDHLHEDATYNSKDVKNQPPCSVSRSLSCTLGVSSPTDRGQTRQYTTHSGLPCIQNQPNNEKLIKGKKRKIIYEAHV